MIICATCGLSFTNKKIYANHIRWQHKDNTEYLRNVSNRAKLAADKKFGKYVIDNTLCHNCTKSIEIKYRTGKRKDVYFCSRSCANSRGKRTDDVKKKISNSMKEAWNDGKFDDASFVNNKIFSSKEERRIVKYFKSKYAIDEWKSGGLLKLDEYVFISRDMWSDKLKICFEYDGIWHFKDINGQLNDKKYKDFLLEKWCLDNNYRLIRIEDGFSDMSVIENLIYNDHRPIIKIGRSYGLEAPPI